MLALTRNGLLTEQRAKPGTPGVTSIYVHYEHHHSKSRRWQRALSCSGKGDGSSDLGGAGYRDGVADDDTGVGLAGGAGGRETAAGFVVVERPRKYTCRERHASRQPQQQQQQQQV
jgi:hypothetical protein